MDKRAMEVLSEGEDVSDWMEVFPSRLIPYLRSHGIRHDPVNVREMSEESESMVSVTSESIGMKKVEVKYLVTPLRVHSSDRIHSELFALAPQSFSAITLSIVTTLPDVQRMLRWNEG